MHKVTFTIFLMVFSIQILSALPTTPAPEVVEATGDTLVLKNQRNGKEFKIKSGKRIKYFTADGEYSGVFKHVTYNSIEVENNGIVKLVPTSEILKIRVSRETGTKIAGATLIGLSYLSAALGLIGLVGGIILLFGEAILVIFGILLGILGLALLILGAILFFSGRGIHSKTYKLKKKWKIQH